MCGQVVSDQEPRKLDTNPVEPAVRPFSEILEKEGLLLHDDENPWEDLFDTANEAQFLISGVVRELLSDSPDHIQGLDPLLDAIDDPEVDRVTIVTLNHDLLLEQLLEQSLAEGENGHFSFSSIPPNPDQQ